MEIASCLIALVFITITLLLTDRVEKLEQAIRKHRSARGHDACWLNDEELYSVLPDTYPDRHLPPKAEFQQRCQEYCEQVYQHPERVVLESLFHEYPPRHVDQK